MFRITDQPIDTASLRDTLRDDGSGGYVSFEGWVRDHHEGRRVTGLEYEAYEVLAVSEGARIVAEAKEKFGAAQVACVHRVGSLAIGDMAVWVGASAPHRDEAFAACRYVIDEVKLRVPVWKKEHYVEGESTWVNCARCAEAGHDHSARSAAATAEPDVAGDTRGPETTRIVRHG